MQFKTVRNRAAFSTLSPIDLRCTVALLSTKSTAIPRESDLCVISPRGSYRISAAEFRSESADRLLSSEPNRDHGAIVSKVSRCLERRLLEDSRSLRSMSRTLRLLVTVRHFSLLYIRLSEQAALRLARPASSPVSLRRHIYGRTDCRPHSRSSIESTLTCDTKLIVTS